MVTAEDTIRLVGNDMIRKRLNELLLELFSLRDRQHPRDSALLMTELQKFAALASAIVPRNSDPAQVLFDSTESIIIDDKPVPGLELNKLKTTIKVASPDVTVSRVDSVPVGAKPTPLASKAAVPASHVGVANDDMLKPTPLSATEGSDEQKL